MSEVCPLFRVVLQGSEPDRASPAHGIGMQRSVIAGAVNRGIVRRVFYRVGTQDAITEAFAGDEGVQGRGLNQSGKVVQKNEANSLQDVAKQPLPEFVFIALRKRVDRYGSAGQNHRVDIDKQSFADAGRIAGQHEEGRWSCVGEATRWCNKRG